MFQDSANRVFLGLVWWWDSFYGWLGYIPWLLINLLVYFGVYLFCPCHSSFDYDSYGLITIVQFWKSIFMLMFSILLYCSLFTSYDLSPVGDRTGLLWISVFLFCLCHLSQQVIFWTKIYHSFKCGLHQYSEIDWLTERRGCTKQRSHHCSSSTSFCSRIVDPITC